MKRSPLLILALLAGCQTLPFGPAPSSGQGASRQSHPITLTGKLYTQNGALYTRAAKVRLLSVTPGNSLDTTVDATAGRYTLPNVPTALQVRLTVTAGSYTKSRLISLLNGLNDTCEVDFGGRDDSKDAIASYYALDTVWCTADPAEGGYAVRAVITPAPTASSIPVYQSSEVPVYKASTIPTSQASQIPTAQASSLTVCAAHPVVPVASPGLDVTPQQATFDARLTGTWSLSIPSTGYVDASGQTQAIEGASLGTLVFQSDGSYTWGKATGKALQVLPHNDATPNTSYWQIQDAAAQVFYVTANSASTLTLYAPGTNLSDGTGTRAGS
ncbi:MAG TPA: hypothetical protein V6D47_00145 [Oscillatoriaceae cyanobacterium]